ncbi:TPA: hypothetical protein LT055_002860 [Salmonella enterica subsp. enterica serovar Wedding]|nr:hypothetical protein [Salmonella enterica]EHJ5406869.1 hypothetical protein [Salmonella enterica subsp. enterica serovar Wedding]HBM0101343.1 hypothetical protein [Salmonella enterica subsp. enterica serovar Wedding]
MKREVYVEFRESTSTQSEGRFYVVSSDGIELFHTGSLMESAETAKSAGYIVYIPVRRQDNDRRNAAHWKLWE